MLSLSFSRSFRDQKVAVIIFYVDYVYLGPYGNKTFCLTLAGKQG